VKPYYEEDGITIYNADWRDVLPLSADLVLTDPPYGIGFARGGGFAANAPVRLYEEGSDWDQAPPSMADLEQIISCGKQAIVWGGNHLGLAGGSCWLVWDKDNAGSPFADAELAWTNLKGAVRMKRHRWHGMLQQATGHNREHRVHPTQKPVSLMLWCMEQEGGEGSVLDPFMGSGSALVAAKSLRRQAIGIEIEEHYCEIAAERLRQGVLL
jgi:DNA modification methylase